MSVSAHILVIRHGPSSDLRTLGVEGKSDRANGKFGCSGSGIVNDGLMVLV